MIIALPRIHWVWFLLALLLVPARHSCGQEMPARELAVTEVNLTLGKPPVTLDGRIWGMAFTPDGKQLLTVTDKIDKIEWPSKARRILWQADREKGESIMRATFSPDCSHYARANNGDKVYVHEAATGKLLHTFQGRTPRFTDTAWSSDGGRLAVGADHEAVIYDIKSGNAVQRLAFSGSDITALAWSPDDKWIVAATENAGEGGCSVFLRSVAGNTAPVPLPGNREIKFSFSPDSAILAVSGEEVAGEHSVRGILYYWDIAAGKEIFRRPGGFNHILHSPDGKWFAACGLSSILILDAQTGNEVRRLSGDTINSHVWSAAFSPDGKILAACNEDRICFRETTTWTEIDPDENLRAPVSAMAFTDDGRHLVTGGWNGDMVLWDWEKKTPVWKRLAAQKEWEIKGLSIDPTARWIGVVQLRMEHVKNHIRLVDFATGETVRLVEVPGVADMAPLFHPSRRTAYLSTRDHELVEWDCENGQTLRKLPVNFLRSIESGRYGVINSVSFDPATPDVIRWNAETQAFGRIDVGSGVESFTGESRKIRPDNDPIPPRSHDFAALGSAVWNLPSLNEATKRENHSPRPSVRHPSELLQFSAMRSQVRAFDILSQSFIHAFDFGPGEIKAIALSPDGRTLVAATTGGVRYLSLEGFPVAEGTSPEILWRLMGGNDHWQAYQASWALARQPDYIRFLESQLTSAREPAADEIARLKLMLADSDHIVRQAAARQWLDLGQELDKGIYATLCEGGLSEQWPSPLQEDVRFPMLSSGDRPNNPIPPLIPLSAHRRAMRAVMLLKADRSDASKRLLERLASGHARAPLTKAAQKALASQR